MKRLFSFALIPILFSPIIYGQQDTTTRLQVTKNLSANYFEKGNRQTKAAFILAGSGLVLGTIAVAIFPKDYDIYNYNSSKTDVTAGFSTALFLTGASLLITSMPYFIAGGINKHKAKLVMKTESVSISPRWSLPIHQFKTGIVMTI